MLKATRILVCASLWSACSGCAGEILQVGNDDPPPVATPKDLASRCTPPSTRALSFQTRDAMDAALRGRWFRCRGEGPGILFPPGFEITDGLAWYSLVDDGSGALVRAHDDAHYGEWFASPPLMLSIGFKNRAHQQLTLLVDETGQYLTVTQSGFESVDLGYVKE